MKATRLLPSTASSTWLAARRPTRTSFTSPRAGPARKTTTGSSPARPPRQWSRSSLPSLLGSRSTPTTCPSAVRRTCESPDLAAMNDAVAAAGPFATILGHSRAGRCCSGAVARASCGGTRNRGLKLRGQDRVCGQHVQPLPWMTRWARSGGETACWCRCPQVAVPEQGGVLAWRQAELAAVLPAELRDAVIPHLVADSRYVNSPHEEKPRLLKPHLLLELDRAQAGDRAKAPVERGGTDAARPCEFLNAEWLLVVVCDPADCLADVGHAAVDDAQLADTWSERALQQPPDDLALEHRCQDRPVAVWSVKQGQHADDRIQQL